MKGNFTSDAIDARNKLRDKVHGMYCEIAEDLDGRYDESSERDRITLEIEKVNEIIDYLHSPDSDNPNCKPVLTYEMLKSNNGVVYFVLDQFELRNVISEIYVQASIHEMHLLIYQCYINENQ